MNPQDSTQQPQASHPEWFTGEHITYAPAPKKRPTKRIVAIVTIVALVIGGGVATALAVAHAKSVQCLDSSAYQELAGEPYEGTLDPTKDFYTYTITFKSGGTDYDDTGLPKNSDAIRAFGEFYKKHADIPQTYTLSTVRMSEDNWYLSQDRTDIVVKALIESGVPEEAIAQEPVVVPIDASGELDDPDGVISEDGSIDLNSVRIRLTSTRTCEQ
jgi:hypothetical protein